jgi:hypothetical protein
MAIAAPKAWVPEAVAAAAGAAAVPGLAVVVVAGPGAAAAAAEVAEGVGNDEGTKNDSAAL